MPFMIGTVPISASGVQSKTLKKPAGAVIITAIHINSGVGDLFSKLWAFLLKDDNVERLNWPAKVVPNPVDGGVSWHTHQIWPHNYILYLKYRSAFAAGNWYYHIEYEIVEPEKKVWGE